MPLNSTALRTPETINTTSGFHLKFINVDAYFKTDSGDIKLTECVFIDDQLTFQMLDLPSQLSMCFSLDNNDESKVSLSHIKSLEFISSGDLNFMYSLQNIQYKLNKQKLYFKSNHSLNMDFLFASNKKIFYVNGFVNKGILSEMNLFPSFNNWFRQNVYVIPLTLITTVLGGVALLININKKNE